MMCNACNGGYSRRIYNDNNIQANPALQTGFAGGVASEAKTTRKKNRNNNTYGRFGGPNTQNALAARPRGIVICCYKGNKRA